MVHVKQDSATQSDLPVLFYALRRSWRPRSPAWLLFCVLPALLLLASVTMTEYYNYVCCWALPLREDLPPHAKWHDFRNEEDWRTYMLTGPGPTSRPLSPAESAQMVYELKRGPMGGELGSAVQGSVLALFLAGLVGAPSAVVLLWRMSSRRRWVALLCMGIFVALGSVAYYHGYLGAAFD